MVQVYDVHSQSQLGQRHASPTSVNIDDLTTPPEGLASRKALNVQLESCLRLLMKAKPMSSTSLQYGHLESTVTTLVLCLVVLTTHI